MLKKTTLSILTSVTMLLLLTSCGNGSSGGDSGGDEGPAKVDNYTKETETYKDKPEATTTKVRFHYRRKDDDGSLSSYVKWQIWSWDTANGGNGAWYEFTKYDDYGVICDITLADVAKDGNFTSQIGFIVSTVNWTKDGDADRYVDVLSKAPGGVQEVYLYQGKTNIYNDPDSPFLDTLGYATLNSLNEVLVTFKPNDSSFAFNASKLVVKKNGSIVNNYTVGSYASKKVTITFNEPLDITDSLSVGYAFSSTYTDEKVVAITKYFDTDDFKNKYHYTGTDLGVSFDNENNPSKTTFKLWAPTTKSVKLNLYEAGNGGTASSSVQMTKGEKGVFEKTFNEDLDGKYYTYTVTNSKGTNEVVDPYAKSAGLNGQRGMVVNFTRLNKQISGWDSDTRPSWGRHSYGSEAIIYEIHVRDMTINPNSGVSASHRGKYLGLTEDDTTHVGENGVEVSTGLAHLEELGITHVQIQPFYDYSSVDESLDTTVMSETNYNWGYDPLNYNVLEGSYSTNPSDGYNRIIEFKQMVMALHSKGISVNMDVVYNHTSGFDTSNLQKIVPNYYYRTSVSGTPSNGSGCGNELASNRFMVNKFVRESVKFYTSEYHLSGYRFDLMGLMDNQVMIDVYNDNKAIYDSVMVYGEPWTGGTTPLEGTTDPNKLDSQQTIQNSLSKQYFYGDGVLVGAFNDQIRNAIKGDNGPGKGWINGLAYSSAIEAGVKGMFKTSASTISPSQVINYVSCHDNYTLFDHLTLNTKGSTRVMKDLYTQADAIVLMACGVAFMQEGEDFMRSKAYVKDGETIYEHNSYNVGDFINNMDYELKSKNMDVFNYFKETIELRKDIEGLSINTREEVSANIKAYSGSTASAKYEIHSGSNTYLVIHSVGGGTFNVGSGYTLVLNSKLGSTVSGVDTGSVTLGSNQTIVLRK